MPVLFQVPTRAGKDADKTLAKKSQSKAKTTATTLKGGSTMLDMIANIKAMTETALGQYKDKYQIIRDRDTLSQFIDKVIENKIIAIDTETTGLDPLLDNIAGPCIYTPGMKSAYVPMNHVSYITDMPVPDQLSNKDVKEEFERFIDAGVDIIMFNAAFDIRFLKNQVGIKDMYCTWDCYLAARCLNENEGAGNNNLKKLHQKYVLNGEGDAFRFDDLFKGIPFTKIPINIGYLYAAHDPEITYELYDYQKPFLTATDEECINHELQDVAWVFHNIEMPCVKAVVDMEDTGVEFDFNYNDTLKEKYHALLNDKQNEFYKLCSMYSKEIESYRKANINNKLDEQINISSTQQLAILLYDIIKVEQVIDKRTKQPSRGTGEDILKQIDNPLCRVILEYRTLSKLVDTYIDKLPECVNPNTGRIHCKFNQYGADTGRMSSSEPNLQNIPSHNKDIRKVFKATSGEELIPEVDNHFEVDKWCEVKSQNGWISACRVVVGDMLEVDDDTMITVTKIEPVDKNHILLYY